MIRTVGVGLGILVLTAGAGCVGTSTGDGEKPAEGCKYRTDKGSLNFRQTPIPAGFFDFGGRRCESYAGAVRYAGRAINHSDDGWADTIVNRYGDPVAASDPVGTEGSVDIELLAMSLASTEPITVLCDGGPTRWNVGIDLSQAAASRGTLTAVKEHVHGGTAENTLVIYPRFRFVYVEDPNVVRIVDSAAEGLDPVHLQATFAWAHAFDPADPDAGSGFLGGIDGRSEAQKDGHAGADGSGCIQYRDRAGDHMHDACRIPGRGGEPVG